MCHAHPCNADVLDEDRCNTHAQSHPDGNHCRSAIDQRNYEWAQELAEEINPSHSCIQDLAPPLITFGDDDDLEALAASRKNCEPESYPVPLHRY